MVFILLYPLFVLLFFYILRLREAVTIAYIVCNCYSDSCFIVLCPQAHTSHEVIYHLSSTVCNPPDHLLCFFLFFSAALLAFSINPLTERCRPGPKGLKEILQGICTNIAYLEETVFQMLSINMRTRLQPIKFCKLVEASLILGGWASAPEKALGGPRGTDHSGGTLVSEWVVHLVSYAPMYPLILWAQWMCCPLTPFPPIQRSPPSSPWLMRGQFPQ
ncbi:E5 [Felis catus papillomavirus 3]|uniref:E5 n=1 Tax=Felis catus papillomavirus 3 TaxID=1336600 RepID=R4V0R7_9PAPI|nr:E5 [Felis catus papillomavirus 3]AGM37982.1 E5 [Felis catus papillomavirus 3]AVM18363.1 early protein 5 [Felis catus papillomavirus 3]